MDNTGARPLSDGVDDRYTLSPLHKYTSFDSRDLSLDFELADDLELDVHDQVEIWDDDKDAYIHAEIARVNPLEDTFDLLIRESTCHTAMRAHIDRSLIRRISHPIKLKDTESSPDSRIKNQGTIPLISNEIPFYADRVPEEVTVKSTMGEESVRLTDDIMRLDRIIPLQPASPICYPMVDMQSSPSDEVLHGEEHMKIQSRMMDEEEMRPLGEHLSTLSDSLAASRLLETNMIRSRQLATHNICDAVDEYYFQMQTSMFNNTVLRKLKNAQKMRKSTRTSPNLSPCVRRMSGSMNLSRGDSNLEGDGALIDMILGDSLHEKPSSHFSNRTNITDHKGGGSNFGDNTASSTTPPLNSFENNFHFISESLESNHIFKPTSAQVMLVLNKIIDLHQECPPTGSRQFSGGGPSSTGRCCLVAQRHQAEIISTEATRYLLKQVRILDDGRDFFETNRTYGECIDLDEECPCDLSGDGCIINATVPPSGRLVIVGDTHGQLEDVLFLFFKYGLPHKNNVYLFNGDVTDRGSHSLEILIIIFLFKLMDKSSVFLTRGNHEDEYCNINYGFLAELKHKYGQIDGGSLHQDFLDTFYQLPLACLLDTWGGEYQIEKVVIESDQPEQLIAPRDQQSGFPGDLLDGQIIEINAAPEIPAENPSTLQMSVKSGTRNLGLARVEGRNDRPYITGNMICSGKFEYDITWKSLMGRRYMDAKCRIVIDWYSSESCVGDANIIPEQGPLLPIEKREFSTHVDPNSRHLMTGQFPVSRWILMEKRILVLHGGIPVLTEIEDNQVLPKVAEYTRETLDYIFGETSSRSVRDFNFRKSGNPWDISGCPADISDDSVSRNSCSNEFKPTNEEKQKNGSVLLSDFFGFPYKQKIPPCPVTGPEKCMYQILWNDPREFGEMKGRGTPFFPDQTHTFLENNNLRLLVRSHQLPPNQRGFRFHHDNHMITIFSASNYCGTSQNCGGVILLTDPTYPPSGNKLANYHNILPNNKGMEIAEHWAPSLSVLGELFTKHSHATLDVRRYLCHNIEKTWMNRHTSLAYDDVDEDMEGLHSGKINMTISVEKLVSDYVISMIVLHKHVLWFSFYGTDTERSLKVKIPVWEYTMANCIGSQFPWKTLSVQLDLPVFNGFIHYSDFLNRFRCGSTSTSTGVQLPGWSYAAVYGATSSVFRCCNTSKNPDVDILKYLINTATADYERIDQITITYKDLVESFGRVLGSYDTQATSAEKDGSETKEIDPFHKKQYLCTIHLTLIWQGLLECSSTPQRQSGRVPLTSFLRVFSAYFVARDDLSSCESVDSDRTSDEMIPDSSLTTGNRPYPSPVSNTHQFESVARNVNDDTSFIKSVTVPSSPDSRSQIVHEQTGTVIVDMSEPTSTESPISQHSTSIIPGTTPSLSNLSPIDGFETEKPPSVVQCLLSSIRNRTNGRVEDFFLKEVLNTQKTSPHIGSRNNSGTESVTHFVTHIPHCVKTDHIHPNSPSGGNESRENSRNDSTTLSSLTVLSITRENFIYKMGAALKVLPIDSLNISGKRVEVDYTVLESLADYLVDSNTDCEISLWRFSAACYTHEWEPADEVSRKIEEHACAAIYFHRNALKCACVSLDDQRCGEIQMADFTCALLALNDSVPKDWCLSIRQIEVMLDHIKFSTSSRFDDTTDTLWVNYDEFMYAFEVFDCRRMNRASSFGWRVS